MQTWWIYIILFTFVFSAFLTDFIRFLAVKISVVDRPTKIRKKHMGAIPALGGLAVYGAFSISIIILLISGNDLTSGEIEQKQIFGFLLGGFILMIGGFIDDKFDLPAKCSVLFPVAAAAVAAFSGIGPSKITNPLGGAFDVAENFAMIFTFMWLLGMSYTTKLLDGIDGLAAGITTIGAIMIALLALSTKYYQPDVALIALVAAGALLGFLVWNFNPAKIFLGEGGSTFVGYLLGGIAIISGSKVATALLVIGVPMLDVVFVIWQRWRAGVKITGGDRRHLHFKFYDRGWSQRQVVVLYYCVAIVFGLTTLFFESWQKLLAIAVLFIIMLFVIYYFFQDQKYE